MGKQVGFYMTTDDERRFLEAARACGSVVLLMWRQGSPRFEELEELPPVGDPFGFAACLWNRDTSPPPVLNPVAERGYYTVEKNRSEVVEFSRSRLSEGVLTAGRLWVLPTYWELQDEPPSLVRKGEAFLRWYDRLARWIRKSSVGRVSSCHLLPGAAAFVSAGGECR